MLSIEPTDLHAEIKNAIEFRKKHHADLDSRIRKLAGTGYLSGDHLGDDGNLVNHQAAWLSVMLPRLVHNNPKAAVNGGRSLADKAKFTKLFLDEWVKFVDLAHELKLVARDYGLYWGLTYTTVEKDIHLSLVGDDVYLPRVERHAPWRLVIDPAAEDWRKGRYIGHIWYSDKEDLLEHAKSERGKEEGWIPEAIEKIAEGASSSDEERGDHNIPDRKEILCVTIWIPERQEDPDLGPADGFHGTLLSMAVDGSADATELIREPTPYHGPDYGPYDLFGYMSVPKSPIPLSPLSMTTGQESMLSAMVMEANDGAKSYRKIVLVPSGSGDVGQLVAVAKNQVIEVPGMSPEQNPIEVEFGGVTDQQLKNIAYAERQLGLISGMDNAQQGEVTGKGTATEHAIAESSMQTRSGGMVDQFRTGVNRILHRAAWYLWHDEAISMPVPPDELGGTQEMESPWVVGGGDEADRANFMMLGIDIEAMSMERTTEALQQRRVMQAFNIVIQVVPLMRQYPEWDWRRLIGMIGDTMNLPDIGDLVDVDMLAQMIGMQLNMTQPANQQPAQGGGNGIPSLVQNFGQAEGRELVGNSMGGAIAAGGV